MIIFSLIFYFLACLCVGRLLQRGFPGADLTVSERFVLGAGTIGLATFVFALPGLVSLRVISLVLLSLPIVAVAILDFQSLRTIHLKRAAIEAAILGVLLIPLSLILLHLPPLGDSLVNWALIVKDMLTFHDLPRAGQLSASGFQSYPILGRLFVINGLTLYGGMHDGAGRVIMFVLSSMGSLFVYEKLKTYFSTTASVVAAAGVHILIFLANYMWYTEWLVDGPFAVILLVSSYQLVTTFSSQEPPGWSKVAILSISLMALVSLRPDGLLFLLQALFLGGILLAACRTNVKAKVFKLIVSLSGPSLLVLVWQAYVVINQFTPQKQVTGAINSPLTILSGILHQFIARWFRLGPTAAGFLLAVVLALVVIKRLDREEKALLLLLLVPVYRFLTLIAAFAMTFSPGEAARPGFLFERYMYQASFTTFFVLAFVGLRFLEVHQVSLVRKSMAYAAIAAAVVLHLGIGFFLSMVISTDDYRHVNELVATIKEKNPDLRSVQVLDQDGPDFLWEVTRYYASPEIITKGSNTIGRPVSASSYWYINERRKETNIQSQTQYLEFLHRNGIQGILVLESDPELERIMETELSTERVYLFRVTQTGFDYQWSVQRPAWDAPKGPSLETTARVIWSKLKARVTR